MGWLDAAGSIVGGLLGFGASENNKEAAAAGTTTRAEIDPRLAPYYYGNQSTERRLRPGVNPIYTGGGAPTTGPNGEPLVQGPLGATGYYDATDSFVDVKSPLFQGGGQQQLANPESDYETVQTGSPGIFDLAQSQFQAGAYKPEQAALDTTYLDFINKGAPIAAGLTGSLGGGLAAGEASYNLTPLDPNVSLDASRKAQGELDPTKAMTGLLSGEVDTSQLGALHQQAITKGAQGYDDLLRKVTTDVLPGMRSEAINAGQYGGSRQGIAEGLLAEQLARNARDITQSNNDIASVELQKAYDAAQQRKYGTATGLSDQGYQAAQGNIVNTMNLDTLGMSNNTSNINNMVQGVKVMDAGFDTANKAYTAAQGAMAAPSEADWGNLGKYTSVVLQGAGQGGSTNVTQPQGTNYSQIAGGALTGMELAKSFIPNTPTTTSFSPVGPYPGGYQYPASTPSTSSLYSTWLP